MHITARPTIDLQVQFNISEAEARALNALAGYGDDEFVRVFYAHLGKAYMADHEDGLRLFLATIRQMMPGILARADAARKEFAR